MDKIEEALILLKWIQQSEADKSQDYSFLLNLFLEIQHLINECPDNAEGWFVKNQLQSQNNAIQQRIENLENQIDGFIDEYFDEES